MLKFDTNMYMILVGKNVINVNCVYDKNSIPKNGGLFMKSRISLFDRIVAVLLAVTIVFPIMPISPFEHKTRAAEITGETHESEININGSTQEDALNQIKDILYHLGGN